MGHGFIKNKIQRQKKTGWPADLPIFLQHHQNGSDLIISFMKELFQRKLVTFNQLTITNEDISVSFLDLTMADNSLLNHHDHHLMAQLIVSNFYKFFGQLSDDQLVRIAYLTVSKIPQIKQELLLFCLHGFQNDNPSWVISELRDIISTGITRMDTIRRLEALQLEDDGELEDDFDNVIARLKLHLKTREIQIEKLMVKAPLYEPEVNKYVKTNCGLNVTANNALIVGKFSGICF